MYVSSNWSEKPTTSNSRQPPRVLERDERHAAGAQLRLHVDPRRVAALGQRPRVIVQDAVEDLEAEVAHPDVVDIGEREADARVDAFPVLPDRAVLAPHVARRLLHAVHERRVWMLRARRSRRGSGQRRRRGHVGEGFCRVKALLASRRGWRTARDSTPGGDFPLSYPPCPRLHPRPRSSTRQETSASRSSATSFASRPSTAARGGDGRSRAPGGRVPRGLPPQGGRRADAVRARAGAHERGRAHPRDGREAAAPPERPPRRGRGRRGRLGPPPVRGRGRGRLPLGARGRRHEEHGSDERGRHVAPRARGGREEAHPRRHLRRAWRTRRRGARRGACSSSTSTPDAVRAEYVLGEIGAFSLHMLGRTFYPIQVAEKGMCWVRATFRGEPGHAAMPRRRHAVLKLSRALARLSGHRLPMHPTVAVRSFVGASPRAAPAAAGGALAGSRRRRWRRSSSTASSRTRGSAAASAPSSPTRPPRP